MLTAAVVHQALTGHARIFIAIMAVAFSIVILELVRTHRLQERYSVLWLATAVIMLVVAAWPSVLSAPGSVLGIQTPGLAVFAVAFLAMLLLLLHLTGMVSGQGEHITQLAQELAVERAHRQVLEELGQAEMGQVEIAPKADDLP
jgi:hypothetical protein